MFEQGYPLKIKGRGQKLGMIEYLFLGLRVVATHFLSFLSFPHFLLAGGERNSFMCIV